MIKSNIVETSLAALRRLSNSFTGLVLGPEVQTDSHLGETVPNNQGLVSISFLVDYFIAQDSGKGEITEVTAFEPEVLSSFLEELVHSAAKCLKIMSLLGVEKVYWQRFENSQIYVMSGDDATQLLYATQQLLKSKAIDIIVINELLLKADRARSRNQSIIWLSEELRKLKKETFGCATKIVLINPATSERKQMIGELETICSHQFSLHNEVEKDESKTGIRRF